MQTHQRSRTWFRQSKVVNLVGRISIAATFGLLCVIAVLGYGAPVASAQMQRNCAGQDHLQVSKSGKALNYHVIASRTTITSLTAFPTMKADCNAVKSKHTDVLSKGIHVVNMNYSKERESDNDRMQRASHSSQSQVANRGKSTAHSNVALVKNTQASSSVTVAPMSYTVSNAAAGTRNPFPYGQCTWWADQRYYQMHHVFVPWQNNANAWQWTMRASQAGWNVSSAPQVGDIMVLQPGVQGAGGLGHVGVIEQVLSGGRFIASSMNWGANRGGVSNFQFTSGSGVAFLRQ